MSDLNIISSPHLHKGIHVNRVMRQVILALLPGILVSTWFYGPGVLVQCVFAILFALFFEYLMLKARKQPVGLYINDGSAVITALLFAITISPFTPIWVNLVGMGFAVCICKHCFGGLGYNLFNPAMAGYVFVLLCFPLAVSVWPQVIHDQDTASFLQTLQIIFAGSNTNENFDALTGATPLGYVKSQLSGMAMISEVRTSPVFGTFAGRGQEWIALCWLIGGVWLIMARVIRWQFPVIFLMTIFLLSLFFSWSDAERYISPMLTLFTGGTMLAAFFIVTDPVTASGTPRGRIIYLAGIAILTYLIRTWGSYPDGIAFAVLLMNATVPLIDMFTRPKVFGES